MSKGYCIGPQKGSMATIRAFRSGKFAFGPSYISRVHVCMYGHKIQNCIADWASTAIIVANAGRG